MASEIAPIGIFHSRSVRIVDESPRSGSTDIVEDASPRLFTIHDARLSYACETLCIVPGDERIARVETVFAAWRATSEDAAGPAFLSVLMEFIAAQGGGMVGDGIHSALFMSERHYDHEPMAKRVQHALVPVLMALSACDLSEVPVARRVMRVLRTGLYPEDDVPGLGRALRRLASLPPVLQAVLARHTLSIYEARPRAALEAMPIGQLGYPFVPAVYVSWPRTPASVDLGNMALQAYAARVATAGPALMSAVERELVSAASWYAERTFVALTGGQHRLSCMRASLPATPQAVTAMHVRDIVLSYTTSLAPFRDAGGYGLGSGPAAAAWLLALQTHLPHDGPQLTERNAFWTDAGLQYRFNVLRSLGRARDGMDLSAFVAILRMHATIKDALQSRTVTYAPWLAAATVALWDTEEARIRATVIEARRISVLHRIDEAAVQVALLDMRSMLRHAAHDVWHAGHSIERHVVFSFYSHSADINPTTGAVVGRRLLHLAFCRENMPITDAVLFMLCSLVAQGLRDEESDLDVTALLGLPRAGEAVRDAIYALGCGQWRPSVAAGVVSVLLLLRVESRLAATVQETYDALSQHVAAGDRAAMAVLLQMSARDARVPLPMVLLLLQAATESPADSYLMRVHASVFGSRATMPRSSVVHMLRRVQYPEMLVAEFNRRLGPDGGSMASALYVPNVVIMLGDIVIDAVREALSARAAL